MIQATIDQAFAIAHEHHQAGQIQQAKAIYQQILSHNPNHVATLLLLGTICGQAGENDAALDLIGRAAALQPQLAEAHSNLGLVWKAKGRLEEACASCQRALAIKPDFAEAHNNLGIVLYDMGKLDQAISSLQRALAIKPDYPEAHFNLANTLRKNDQLDEAVTSYRRALALRPNYAEAYNNLAGALKDSAQLDEAMAAYQRVMTLNPTNARIHSNLVYLLHFHVDYDAQRILEEHRRWAKRFAEPLAAKLRPHDNDPSPDRRLRIGYISADFRAHPVGRFLAPLFSQHDRSNYEIFCYSAVVKPDPLTLRLQSHTDHWHDILPLHEEAIAEQIRADRIDVLVDLTLHMDSNYMMVFARKPAPVQVTWLGYASTTGLKTMDYRLSDPYLDPPGVGDQNYVEETIRLPHSFWCYELTDWMPPVNPLPALKAGHVTFACFNNFAKVTRPTQDLWATLLRAVPGSRLLIHSRAGRHQDDIRRRFVDAGIEPTRLEFVGINRMDKYFAQYHAVDIVLDPFPYGGGTTTCDALAMGVPVITLAGQTAVGRAGVSLLNNLGLPELVAHIPEQYVQLAATLAGDLDRLAALRSTLRDRMRQSPLTNAPRFARDMEAAYRQMWQRWCQKTR